MKEGIPKVKEDIYFKPNNFKFVDYFNEFVASTIMYKSGFNFNEVLEFLKKNPIRSVEEYLDYSKNKSDFKKIISEYERFPQKMARLNNIVKDINSLNENEENKFKELTEEVVRLLY